MSDSPADGSKTVTPEVLARIEALHRSTPVRTYRGEGLYCSSCTREVYPCPTLRIVVAAKDGR